MFSLIVSMGTEPKCLALIKHYNTRSCLSDKFDKISKLGVRMLCYCKTRVLPEIF